MRDQFYMNNYGLHSAANTAIDLIILLGFNFPGCSCCEEKKKKQITECLSQMDWRVSLTPEKV